MNTCLPFAPWLCANFHDDVNFWEVGVSFLTIVVSLLGAWIIAYVATKRDRRAKRFDRRAEAIDAFRDLGATVLLEMRKGDEVAYRVRVSQGMNRISIYSRTTEREMHAWMQHEGEQLVGLINDAWHAWINTNVQAGREPNEGEPNLNAALTYYHQRLEDLRYWPSSRETWDKYINEASKRPAHGS